MLRTGRDQECQNEPQLQNNSNNSLNFKLSLPQQKFNLFGPEKQQILQKNGQELDQFMLIQNMKQQGQEEKERAPLDSVFKWFNEPYCYHPYDELGNQIQENRNSAIFRPLQEIKPKKIQRLKKFLELKLQSNLKFSENYSPSKPKIQFIRVKNNLGYEKKWFLENCLHFKFLQKSKDMQCSICVNPCKTGEKLTSLFCEHIFHSNCIQAWLCKSEVCPLCRVDFKSHKIYLDPSRVWNYTASLQYWKMD